MRGKTFTTGMTIALALVLVLGAFTIVSPLPILEEDIRSVPEFSSQYLPHAPIRINSNADFPGIASSGDGNPGTPWIIENWDIIGTGYPYCLYIGNTTDYFIVRDCLLHYADSGWHYPYFMRSGLILWNTQNGTIDNVISRDNTHGIYLNNAKHNRFINNSIGINIRVGVWHYFSSNNVFNGATMIENGFRFEGDLLHHWNTDEIDTSNTINGLPIYYWTNQTIGTVPLSAGEIILGNCSNIMINNNIIDETSYGIQLGFSNNCTIINTQLSNLKQRPIVLSNSVYNEIRNNNVSNATADGIRLENSNFNTLINNTLLDCQATGFGFAWANNNTLLNNRFISNNHGIYLYDSVNNSIRDNFVTASILEGIYFSNSNSNFIFDNRMINNTLRGILLSNSDDNLVYRNNISNNQRGVYLLTGSDNNKMFHNSFVNNSCADAGFSNVWDDGYPSGGNYWSDYTGVDYNSTPTQDVPPPDGIGDTPYTNIGGGAGAQDNYPLMSPGTLPTGETDIWVSPLGFEFTVPENSMDSDMMVIGNGGGENLSYQINPDVIETINITSPQGSFNSVDKFYGQSFVADYEKLAQVAVSVWGKEAPYPDFRIQIWGDYGGYPDSSNVLASGVILGGNISSSSAQFHYFTPGTPVSVVVGQTYWLITDFAYDTNSTGELWRGVNTLNPYTLGNYAHSTNETNWAHELSTDMNCRIKFYGCYLPEWLSITNVSGVISPGMSSNLDLTVNTTAMTPGVYQELLEIESNDPDEPIVIVPVNLTITNMAMGPVQNIDTGEYFSMIQTSINDADTLDGHTIEVSAGTYYENVIITKGVTLIGENNSNTTIDANNVGNNVEILANNIGFRNFKVINAGTNSKAIWLYEVTNCEVSGCLVSDNFWGIYLESSSLNTVSNNNVYFTEQSPGIYLTTSSSFNQIDNNTLSNNWNGIGMSFGSNNNQVENNEVTYNVDRGILLYSVSNNHILSNKISHSGNDGISLGSTCSNNIVENNNISNNGPGIHIKEFALNNIIFHNNFSDNGIQAIDDNGNNDWDNGYPSGGNYWSDYTGVDNNSTATQDVPPPDGIGDTPYTNIQGGAGAQDNYPLMQPYQEKPEYFINLSVGWNLISIPLTQLNYSLDSVLDNINGKWDYAQTYNRITGVWESNSPYQPESTNGFQSMSLQMGFWINITEPDVVLSVVGEEAGTVSIPLYAGWNLVGYPTLTEKTVSDALWGTGADKVEVFDPGEPYRVKEVGPTYVMRPGEGYWVHVPADTVWVVDW